VGNSKFNSLQITAIKSISHGLVFNVNYTFAKVLAVIRKRRFLDVGRESRGGLAELEAEVVEIAFRRRMGTEFVDDRPEIRQGANGRQSRCVCRANQAA
jgi:hypothetical protein